MIKEQHPPKNKPRANVVPDVTDGIQRPMHIPTPLSAKVLPIQKAAFWQLSGADESGAEWESSVCMRCGTGASI